MHEQPGPREYLRGWVDPDLPQGGEQHCGERLDRNSGPVRSGAGWRSVSGRTAGPGEELDVEHAESAHWEDKNGDEHHRGSRMSLQKRTDGNRFSSSLGLARSFRCESARAWRCVRDLRGQLAKSLPDNGRQYEDHTLRRSDGWDGARLLRALWYAPVLRANSFAAHGEYTARTLQNAHGPRGSVSYCHRRNAGVGLLGRAVGAVEGIPRRSVGALKKSEAAEVRRFLLNSQAAVDGFELAPGVKGLRV
jgi:hypothetical protein